MSEPENFLSRWARRKREVADESKAPATTGPTAEQPTAEQMPAAAVDASRVSLPKEETPAFDPASLPSLESITADTDIRGFFAPGVPAELTHAALRRAWTADPMIRDFVGLAENDWDFNNPGSIPGFGSLEMTPELRREVERIVGNFLGKEEPAEPGAAPPQPPAAGAQPQEAVGQIASGPAGDSPHEDGNETANTDPRSDDSPCRLDELPQDAATFRSTEVDTAMQQSAEPLETLQLSARRGHGGALPK